MAKPLIIKTPNYACELCKFITTNKKDYNRHVLTPKHATAMFNDANISKTPKKTQDASNAYLCICGKEYKHQSSLWNHKQKCKINSVSNNTPLILQEAHATPATDGSTNQISCELVIELLKQNNEFRELLKDQNKQMMEQNKYFIENQNKQTIEQNKQMMEQNKQMMELVSKGVGNTINSNNTTKNKFNLNIFLNEQCKDAMNIMDFVNSLQLKLSDLERVGELGYVKGIGHIVLNKLKALDVCKRPIHCSDLKRETMYVKDENAWEKENGKNEKITKMIKHVAHKNQRQINEWRQENPEHKNPESVLCDKYLAIVNQSMGGSTEDDDINNYNKIIKNIAKEVIIDKEHE